MLLCKVAIRQRREWALNFYWLEKLQISEIKHKYLRVKESKCSVQLLVRVLGT